MLVLCLKMYFYKKWKKALCALHFIFDNWVIDNRLSLFMQENLCYDSITSIKYYCKIEIENEENVENLEKQGNCWLQLYYIT